MSKLLVNRQNSQIMNEIYQKFVHASKSQYMQQQYAARDQVRNLEAVNKSLDLRVKRAKLDMKRQADGRQTTSVATSGDAASGKRRSMDMMNSDSPIKRSSDQSVGV